MKVIIIVIFIILVISLIYLLIKLNQNKSTQEDNTINTINESKFLYSRRSNCGYYLPECLKNFFEDNKILSKDTVNNKKSKQIIYVPCLYDNTDMEISNMPKTKNNFYMVINKCDIFVGKNHLWNFLEQKYKEKVTNYLPKSYLPYRPESIAELKKDYKSDKLYIMKKNLQRQEGIKITSSYDDLINNKDQEFIIIQELLQNPFLVNGRKINLRVYVLLVIYNDKSYIYVYDDGFMYYTPEYFKKGSLDISRNITTGYIDRQVYVDNPLTHDDFREYLGQSRSNIIFQNIRNLIRDALQPYQDQLINIQSFPGSTQFQVFGADVAVNEDMSALLMEINKGPDLNYKDERDGKLKKKLLRDIFVTVGVVESDNNNRFILVN
jgi:tubulin polyglutamylase TTLL9